MYLFQMIFVIAVWLTTCVTGQQAKCEKATDASTCICQYFDASEKSGKLFNFTSLGKESGGPAFSYKKATTPGDVYQYAYNPCYGFTDTHCTESTAACQSNGDSHSYPVGDPAVVEFSVTNEDIVLKYGALSGRYSVVTFHCDATKKKEAGYDVIGQSDLSQNIYYITINTCLACHQQVSGCADDRGGGGGGGGGSLTIGGALCITFTVLVVVYIVGGMLFLRFARGAQGKEMVPNYGFWTDFPSLVKDGVMFLVGLCRRDSSYESIK